MRKYILIAFAAFAMVVFGSCKTKTDVYSTPEKVTSEFVTAFMTADFDNMYKYTVPRNARLIQNIQKMMRERPERLATLQKNKIEIQDVACEYDNDSLALCTCKFTCNGESQSAPYRVKKIEGKWLVDMTEN